ncbi:MAG: glycosyltransferase family 2 protein [Pseudohongiella nitratireducens]|nr:glycosyltransferase family 2 protein [Pseudohongiella nitratireducens]MDF1623675.1 glycosyltransferase family 2 protein [Pseudohongiella nitratireducens]
MTATPKSDTQDPGKSNPASVMLSQCVAIIITWQPDVISLRRLVARLLGQGVEIVIVDNGSGNQPDIAALIDDLKPSLVKSETAGDNTPAQPISWLPWPDNKGLAAGMNRGLSWARQKGYQFAWLFDQDSDISDNFCESMLSAWHTGSQLTGRLAALGPRLVDPESGRKTSFRRFRLSQRSDSKLPGATDLFTADFLISSGTLLSLSALQSIGPMKESYFVDNIDLEWCFRARNLGWQLLGCDRAELLHRIGEVSDNPLVKHGLMVSHGPLRFYYSTRNRLHLRQQPYAPSDWVWRDHLRFLIKTVYLLISSNQRAEYWRALWNARRDSKRLP